MLEFNLGLNAVLEWAGALSGLTGAALLAARGRFSNYGWLFFLLANVLLICWSIRIDAVGLLVQQTGFVLTSLLGIVRSGVFPSHVCRHLFLTRR